MPTLTYFSGAVKILEKPKQTVFNNKITTTHFRVLFPQTRKNQTSKVILLTFWGTLANDVKNYYQLNDYILIEGYLSMKISQNINQFALNSTKFKITGLKAYSFNLKSNNITDKV
jgi:single-stranded DNA-binding protein